LPIIFVASQEATSEKVSNYLINTYPDQFVRLTMLTTDKKLANKEHVKFINDDKLNEMNSENKLMNIVEIDDFKYTLRSNDWYDCLDFNRFC